MLRPSKARKINYSGVEENQLSLAMTLNTQEGPLAGDISHVGQTTPSSLEKVDTKDQQVEEVEVEKSAGDPVFDLDEEPELSARTYIALFSILLLNLVQIVALQGPPTFVSSILMLPLLRETCLIESLSSSSTTSDKASTILQLNHGCRMLSISFKRCWVQSFPPHLIPSKLESQFSW